MDLQIDSIPEIMAQAPTAVPPSNMTLKGFPKEIFSQVEEKFLCGYCELVLREPMQSACGHRFCNFCKLELGRNQTDPVKCQACITEGVPEEESILNVTSMFEDKAAIREMKKLATKCINQGCNWKGVFQDYLTHENTCDKKMVSCSKCGTQVPQAKLTNHETKSCVKRTVSCQWCKQEMIFEQQEKHQGNCPNSPVKCEKCSKQVPKSEMKTHKEEECPHRIVDCPVPDCNMKLPLDQFYNHIGKTPLATQKHMTYLFSRIQKLEKQIEQVEAASASAVGIGTDSGAQTGLEQATGGAGSSVAGAEGGAGVHMAPYSGNVLGTEEKQKLKLHEDLMAVLHGEILRCIKQMEAMGHKLEVETKTTEKLKSSMAILERKMGAFEERLLTIIPPTPDPLEGGTLFDNKDGLLTWKLESFSQIRRAAVNEQKLCVCSPSFYTGPLGYKMRIRLFTNGDGEAKGKSISAFIQLQQGPYDDLLPWPFMGKIFLMIVDQRNFREHKVVSFSALPDQQAFQKPQAEANIASGVPNLILLSEFQDTQDKYLVRDTVYMRVFIELSDTVRDKLNSLNPKNFLRR